MDRFYENYIWIIGASSGIGAALARELVHQGGRVAVSARSEDKLAELHKDLPGDHHISVPLDVADAGAIKKAQKEILKIWPRIDSVIFMSAIYKPHDGKPTDLAFIHKMMDVNVNGAFNVIDAVQPQMEKQGHGQIVLCASVAGYRGLPKGQPYCATKAALINLAESMKIELEPKNIDVKIISPGFVRTPLTDKNDFPMPMMIEAEDAARAIAKGLRSKRFELHFPLRFTAIMKILQVLPYSIYFWLSRKIMQKR